MPKEKRTKFGDHMLHMVEIRNGPTCVVEGKIWKP
jgi:hypothetical protein